MSVAGGSLSISEGYEKVRAVEARGRFNELKFGAVLSYAVIAAQIVVALVYTPVMLRLLGQAEYGLYSVVASVVSYLSLLSFGFGGAYIRFYSRLRVVEDWVGVERLNGMFLIIFSAIGLLALIGGSILALNAGTALGDKFSTSEVETAGVLFAILAANLAISFPTSVFNNYITAHERFIFQKSLLLIKTIASPLAIIPLLLLGYQSIGVAVGTTVVNIAFTIHTILFSRSRLKMRFMFRGLDFGLFREVSVFSGFIFVNMVVDQVNWNVGQFVTGRFHGPNPVAVYGVAALFNMQYLAFATAISSVFVPRVNYMVAAGSGDQQLSQLFTKVGRVQFLVITLVMSGFVFFGQAFIELWAGRSYRDAYFIALLLMIPVTVPLLQNLGIEIQRAKNLHHFRSAVYLAIAVGNVLLCIPLAQQYAGVGAATATAISLVIGNGFIMNWYYRARVGLDINYFWRQIFRLSLGMLPALALGALIVMVIDLRQIGPLIACIAVYIVAYASGMWWLGMNQYERQLVGTPVVRAVRRRGAR